MTTIVINSTIRDVEYCQVNKPTIDRLATNCQCLEPVELTDNLPMPDGFFYGRTNRSPMLLTLTPLQLDYFQNWIADIERLFLESAEKKRALPKPTLWEKFLCGCGLATPIRNDVHCADYKRDITFEGKIYEGCFPKDPKKIGENLYLLEIMYDGVR